LFGFRSVQQGHEPCSDAKRRPDPTGSLLLYAGRRLLVTCFVLLMIAGSKLKSVRLGKVKLHLVGVSNTGTLKRTAKAFDE
jgi:hypothetical protein